jgi:hypothetical protein
MAKTSERSAPIKQRAHHSYRSLRLLRIFFMRTAATSLENALIDVCRARRVEQIAPA